MKIKTSFLDNKHIPIRFTCLGINISPPILISDLPPQTKSIVVILKDLDVDPKPWIHWFLFNIPPDSYRTGEGKIPTGATEGLANNHTFGYEGPCPKYFKGTHRYQLTAYALSDLLDIPAETEAEAIQHQLSSLTLDKDSITGLCSAPVS